MGSRPDCSEPETDSTSFSEEKQLFHFFIFSNWDVKFYVRSWKSWHRPSHVHNFSAIEDDDNEGENYSVNNVGETKADQGNFHFMKLHKNLTL